MIGIYHNRDLDGFASGAIMKLKYPDIKLVGYDYGQPLELETTGEPIIMADVSLPMKTMVKIAQMANFNFTWIDHHISAIKDYKEFVGVGESFCKAILDNSISACEATWKYLFPDKEMPTSILLLGEYDTWRNQDKMRWDNFILPFQFGMRLDCNSPDTFNHTLFHTEINNYDRFIHEIIKDGHTVLKYQKQVNEAQCKKAAFEFEFLGMKAICLNGGGFNSDVFKSIYSEDKYDLMMPFQWDGKQWTISLYSTKPEIDCSVIAKTKGGGGHKGAAGFQVKDITEVFGDKFPVQRKDWKWMRDWIHHYDKLHNNLQSTGFADKFMEWVQSQPLTNAE